MLVLTRGIGESIRIGSDIIVTIVRVKGSRVRIGVSAPTAAGYGANTDDVTQRTHISKAPHV
jgi:hypothetical protein